MRSKLKINCPKCKKEYLFSNDILFILTNSFRCLWVGRLYKIPKTLYCEDCGSIDLESVSCVLPIKLANDWKFKNVFKILIPLLIIFLIICIIIIHV